MSVDIVVVNFHSATLIGRAIAVARRLAGADAG